MAWFKNVFGVIEQRGGPKQYEATRAMFDYDKETGILKVNEGEKKGMTWKAGTFRCVNLKELRGDVAKEWGKVKPGGGKLSVTEVIGDVTKFHVDESNRDAYFQAASQFNCLEFTSDSVTPEEGISIYSSDRTQGPACATSCAPGTIVRNYFGKYEGSIPVGQTETNQVENLDEVMTFLKDNKLEGVLSVKGGYSQGTDEKLEVLNDFLKDPGNSDEVRDRIKIGLQKNTQVVASGFGGRLYTDGELLVHQAYCSACAMGMYSSASDKAWKPFAILALEAAYEATLSAGFLNAAKDNFENAGSKKIYLTALGGGVFGNDMNWIADAIERACRAFQDADLEVYIVSFGSSWNRAKQLEAAFPTRRAV